MQQDQFYLAQKYTSQIESVPCNLCGATNYEAFCDRERFGLPLQTVICKECGLMYINPRPTKEQYAEFYKGDYRKVVSGSDEGDPAKFDEQVAFARRIILPLLRQNASQFSPKTILDLGCSYGGILYALRQNFPGSVGYGLEPLVKISQYARQRTGATVYMTLVEDFEPDQKYDLIVFPRSLNHSLDPRANLLKIRAVLSEDGLFILTLEDPTTKMLRLPLDTVTEMTHPYMFAPETIQYLLDQVGLEVLGYEDGLLDARRMARHDFRKVAQENMRLLARRSPPGERRYPKPDYTEILARIQANQQAYRQYGDYIEKWRRATFGMRVYRKILNTLGLW